MQSVEPRSMSACAKSPERVAGQIEAARRRIVGLAAGSGSSSANRRATTRSTLASIATAWAPKAMAAIAAACGLEPQPVRRFLASEEEADSVHADNLRAHRLGINGVPCFVVSGRHAIAGAQEPEVIERLLDVAAVEASDLI